MGAGRSIGGRTVFGSTRSALIPEVRLWNPLLRKLFPKLSSTKLPTKENTCVEEGRGVEFGPMWKYMDKSLAGEWDKTPAGGALAPLHPSAGVTRFDLDIRCVVCNRFSYSCRGEGRMENGVFVCRWCDEPFECKA
jgi:hypothetical protein